MNEKFFCHVPACKVKDLSATDAQVPSVKDIRQATGKPVTLEELANHTVCRRHARDAREAGFPMYSYIGTAKMLERKAAEKESVGKFFQMKYALKTAREKAEKGGNRPPAKKQVQVSKRLDSRQNL